MKKYDVIVIGAGSAGLGSSGVANVLGLKTLLIEHGTTSVGSPLPTPKSRISVLRKTGYRNRA